MDRGWCRLERVVLPRAGDTAFHIRPRKGRVGADKGISGSDTAEHDRVERSSALSAHVWAEILRSRDRNERECHSPITGLHIPIHPRNRNHALLRPGTDVFGRQHEKEEHSYALWWALLIEKFIVFFFFLTVKMDMLDFIRCQNQKAK